MSAAVPARPPRLTIGVPAYGNEATIAATLDSILAQSDGDFRVLISDDVSPDGTGEICRGFAARDGRITYVRQARNLNYGNFRYLLNAADTPYFMWLAGDDVIAPDFVRENLRVLEARNDVVLSVSRCMFLRSGVEVKLAEGTYPLMAASKIENLLRYMHRSPDNTRMYGIFRTGVAQGAFPAQDFFGYDFALVLGTLLQGKHYEIPEVMMRRDYTPRERNLRLMLSDGKTMIDRLFPTLGITRYAWSKPGFPRSRRMAISFGSLNLNHHFAVCRAYHPRYARILPPVIDLWDRYVGWRANPWRHDEIVAALDQARLGRDR